MKNKLSWFTMIELIISMSVVCILFTVLLSTYSWVSRVWFKIEQERNVYQEILQVSQLLQTVVDNNSIDFESYADLTTNLWVTDVLYLSGKDGKIQIFSSWTCLNMNDIWNQLSWEYCNLYMKNADGDLQLLNNKNANISKPYFKIVPFASEQSYIDEKVACDQWNYLKCINKNWFWLMMTFYSGNYKKSIWELSVKVPVQWFFSLN